MKVYLMKTDEKRVMVSKIGHITVFISRSR